MIVDMLDTLELIEISSNDEELGDQLKGDLEEKPVEEEELEENLIEDQGVRQPYVEEGIEKA